MSIVVENLVKSFGTPPIKIIKDLNFEIKKGEFVSLLGKSGSGKSTLLYLISSLDNPTSGRILIDGNDINKIANKELYSFRNKYMGFVFQFHYLLPEFTALENILMPTIKSNQLKEKRKMALELLARFGLSDKADHLPSQLSGGQMQRVSIARALIMNPKYIFADEPTGALDSLNAKIVMDILKTINKEFQTTIILVTHDEDFALSAQRQINLIDGELAK